MNFGPALARYSLYPHCRIPTAAIRTVSRHHWGRSYARG